MLTLSHRRCNVAELLTAHGGPHGKARLKNIWKSPRATLYNWNYCKQCRGVIGKKYQRGLPNCARTSNAIPK